MKKPSILILLLAAFCLANPASDTLTIHRKTPPIKGSVMFPVTSPTSDMPVGVWRRINKKATTGTIVWFHGGMTSNNCQKGLVAGGSLANMLPDYTVVSASACKQSHWVEPTTIEAVDEALDNLAKRIKKDAEDALLAVNKRIKELAARVKEGQEDIKLSNKNTFRIALAGHYLTFTWIDDEVKLATSEKIPNWDKDKIWAQEDRNRKGMEELFGIKFPEVERPKGDDKPADDDGDGDGDPDDIGDE